jgi:hypothetical protein
VVTDIIIPDERMARRLESHMGRKWNRKVQQLKGEVVEPNLSPIRGHNINSSSMLFNI